MTACGWYIYILVCICLHTWVRCIYFVCVCVRGSIFLCLGFCVHIYLCACGISSLPSSLPSPPLFTYLCVWLFMSLCACVCATYVCIYLKIFVCRCIAPYLHVCLFVCVCVCATHMYICRCVVHLFVYVNACGTHIFYVRGISVCVRGCCAYLCVFACVWCISVCIYLFV